MLLRSMILLTPQQQVGYRIDLFGDGPLSCQVTNHLITVLPANHTKSCQSVFALGRILGPTCLRLKAVVQMAASAPRWMRVDRSGSSVLLQLTMA